MKKVLGLILELNPPHNGHKYFIDKAIKEVKPDYTIAIISGNICQRGELSVISKYDKTKLLLDLGIDVVLELPIVYTINSADLFSYYSIYILNKFGITDLAFGVELDNLILLKQMKDMLDKLSYNDYIKFYLDKGSSYSQASLKAVYKLTDNKEILENFSKPNNTLAIQYLKAIDNINPKINVTLIKRINANYYDTIVKSAKSKIASATSLRSLLANNESIDKFLIDEAKGKNIIDQKQAYGNLLTILKYKINIQNQDITKFKDVIEGIENRIYNILMEVNNFDDLVNKISTRRYTKNRVKRILINIILEITDDVNETYLRLLGFSPIGEKYINTLNEEVKEQIVTSLKNNNSKIAKYELKGSYLLALISNNKNIYTQEFLIPLKKENK
ncbi:MAG: nucleotidyltransferase family protein [Bacilli bacterium]|nr:nucleotidyltransferase family protein [Bacilli bacterium]MDD2682235.1 nucleotidyltransferase family protein [Bacilli bacterium]